MIVGRDEKLRLCSPDNDTGSRADIFICPGAAEIIPVFFHRSVRDRDHGRKTHLNDLGDRHFFSLLRCLSISPSGCLRIFRLLIRIADRDLRLFGRRFRLCSRLCSCLRFSGRSTPGSVDCTHERCTDAKEQEECSCEHARRDSRRDPSAFSVFMLFSGRRLL